MRVYIASATAMADETDHYADALRWAGHTVEVGWEGECDGATGSAEGNFAAVGRCEVFIRVGNPDDASAGRSVTEVELGQALDLGKHVIVVGPLPDACDMRDDVQYLSHWGDCVLDALEGLW